MLKRKTEILHTDRLILGPIRDQDEGRMIGIFLNEEVRKTYMLPEFETPEEAVPLFRRFQSLSLSDFHVVYGIYLQDQLIGFVNDVHADGDTIEMGYVITPEHKNNGYGTEAFSAVIRELFSMGYTVVKAGAFIENPASVRVMEKCGMKRTDRWDEIPYRGNIHLCVNYEITPEVALFRQVEEKRQTVDRIQWMELCFDLLQKTMDTDPAACKSAWFQALLTVLKRYYEGGQWLHDYELDEQGQLPADLKRGVLSQDGIYDFLTRLDAHN